MPRKVLFFATPEDIQPVLRAFAATQPLKFVETGQLTTPNRPIYLTPEELPEPGLATHETASICRAYMVSARDVKNHMAVRTLTNGTTVWNLFGVDNESAVTLSLGGLWHGDALLPGIMDSMYETQATQALKKAFGGALRRSGFKKVKLYWVGPAAMVMLRSGKRLATAAIQSPPAWDLTLPSGE